MATGDAAGASRILSAALELWRGPALDGMQRLAAEAARLQERRLAALEDRIEADLRLGRHSALVAELSELVAAHPLREGLHGHLMLALYRSGRQAEALAVFRELRGRLVEGLGIDPSPPLQRLHERILATDSGLDPPLAMLPQATEPVLRRIVSPMSPDPDPAPVPSQLPPAVSDLTGRSQEIALLREWLLGASAANGPVMCAVSGKAGSGKTALALHVGHALQAAFPDGQLYVNLRGVDPGTALDAREVLAAFLRALGVDAVRLPDPVAERTALYRSLLAGRRVLVVLDDAGSEWQVRPLLPGQPGCAVIVTSRVTLSGLEGAKQLGLDVLEEDDAVRLLARVAGDERVSVEPQAAREIVRLCGCLPLAVLIAGARLADLLRLFASERAEMEDAPAERTEAVRSVLLHWLALVDTVSTRRPSGIIRVRATRANPSRVDPRLAELLQRCPRVWFEAEQDALVIAVERAGELGLGDLACDLAATCASSWFRVHNQFDEWGRTNGAALAATRRTGNLRGQAAMLTGLGQLYYEMDRFGEGNEYFHQALTLFRQIGDRAGEAAALVSLGTARREQGHYAEALQFVEQALCIYQALSDDAGIAAATHEAGVVHRELGRFSEAMAELGEALNIYRAIGSQRDEGLTLRSIGLVHRAVGELACAEELCSQALEVFREIGDRLSETYSMQALVKVHIRQGHGREDLEALGSCLATFRELRDRFGEALALRTLGELHLAEGALETAARCLEQALSLWDELKLAVFKARTLRDLADLHYRRGDLTTADAILKEALEIFCLHGSRDCAELTGRDSAARTQPERLPPPEVSAWSGRSSTWCCAAASS